MIYILRRVRRYQRDNQNPYRKEKEQKDKQRSTKHTHKTEDRVTRTPQRTEGELWWYSYFLSTCTKLKCQGFLKNRLILSFQNFSDDSNTLLTTIRSLGYIWRNMVSAIIFWFKADYCSAIMSHDGLVWCFWGWLRPSYLYNRSNTIHMTTSVLQKLNLFYILLKIRAFFIITLFCSSGYVRGLAFYSHWENTSITLPFYLEGRFGPTFYWSACTKICIYVFVVSILPLWFAAYHKHPLLTNSWS